MDALKRTLIEKAGHENGWENAGDSDPDIVILSSARHNAQIRVKLAQQGWAIEIPKGLIHQELSRSFPDTDNSKSNFVARSMDDLAQVLRRTAELAQALPHQAARTFARRVNEASKTPGFNTETERLTKQRIGQETFREALMDYWEGGCAVSGITLPQILRASHAKPWAVCDTDEERLDVFNGFLLTANLDALFDKGLITFNAKGQIGISTKIGTHQMELLHLNNNLSLRWTAPQHLPYLEWHRRHIFCA